MEKQLAERRRNDGLAITIDRLSQLTQPILQHILSFLSQKDAVRTGVLSKSWRYLWHGRLNVEFVERWFAGKEEIRSFLDKTLQRYHRQNLYLQQFSVNMHCDPKSTALLEKWIPIVLNMGVRSLSLTISPINYAMPLAVFQAEFLVELRLEGFNLNALKSTDNVMLNNLQTLRLRDVHITDETFEKIISSCPLIENVDLVWCYGLESIKLRKHHNIKYFHCRVRFNEIIVEIEDTHSTLESVRIHSCPDFFLHLNHMHFPHLKSLNLYEVQLPAEIFNNLSSFFPCLNELILDSCYGLKEFLLFSCSIKRLTIENLTINKYRLNRTKALIDTPNILYFEYSGYGFLPSIKFATTSNEWKSYISVRGMLELLHKGATLWFLKLSKLLKALSQSHITLDLSCGEYENLHINDSYGGSYKPVVVKHLILSGFFSSSSVPTTLNGIFWICRPRYIYMDQYANEKEDALAEFMCKLITKETGCYFWLQDLEEVSLEVPDMKTKEWHCVEGTSLPALPNNLLEREIRFRLKWRE